MADESIQYTEEMVGAGHPTKADTLNRLALKYLNNDGTPLVANTSVSVNVVNASGDPAHDIAFTPGSCYDDALTEPMVLSASPFVKQIDAAWAVGNEAGGLDTGTVAASTLYALWLIKRTDTGVVDALFSTSFTSPTLTGDLANYGKKRLIGAVLTDSSSNISPFKQVGDYFRFLGLLLEDVDDNTIADGIFESGTLSVPPDSIAHIYGHGQNQNETSSSSALVIRTKGASDVFTVQEGWINTQNSTDNFDGHGCIGQVLVDGSSQIEYAMTQNAGTSQVRINTIGFWMPKRSNP